jgi:hypothetical protein
MRKWLNARIVESKSGKEINFVINAGQMLLYQKKMKLSIDIDIGMNVKLVSVPGDPEEGYGELSPVESSL